MERGGVAAMTNDEYLKQKCNRYTNGMCSALACLMRGGYVPGHPRPNYEMATCEPHEILSELVSLRAAQPRNAGDVAPMGGDDEHSGDLAQRA